METTIDWAKIRQDFPVADNVTYFQSAGMSPIPNAVFRKIMEEYRKVNMFGDIFWMKDKGEVDEFRGILGNLINTSKEDIAFTASNSLAMSLVALSLKLNQNDRFNIISMEEEFPSNTVPFEYLKIPVKYVKHQNHRYGVSSVIEQTDENTLAVMTSYVQFATGFRQDLQSLGNELKKRNILFIVNATQGFPFYPVNVKEMNIDVLTCSFHKWGFAGHTGALFYTSEDFRKRFPSPVAGWLSVKPKEGELIYTGKNEPFEIYGSADQYFFGTMNLQNLLALCTAFEYLQQIGFENIRKRIVELCDYLIEKIKPLPITIVSPLDHSSERSAIISFFINEFPCEECVAFLEKHGVYVSARSGFVRVSVNIFNYEKDFDKLFETLQLYINTRE
ncbi:MAG: aminotransferase class V-fold PLP-dependent enzyme [Bacteroidia bacterium]|nr:aminotransferase class V-fold PLP-dependent enzyme [Bacteroidia bacterium]